MKFWGMPRIPSTSPDGTLYATATAHFETRGGDDEMRAV
jgi:hypothetical protein